MDDALALDAARQAASALGVSGDGAVVVRRAATAQVRLPAAGAVARVHPPQRGDAADRETRVGRVLEHGGVPAARLLPGRQPVGTPAGRVTVWTWLEATGAAADLSALAGVARVLHDGTRHLAPAPPSLPDLDPLGAALVQLDAPGARAASPRGDRRLLTGVAARLAAEWPALTRSDPLGRAVVHGDLHRDNVVVTATGPALVDLELAGLGPRSYDLAAIAVAGRRYGAPAAEVDAAIVAYGADPRGWPGFEHLCEVYELWVTAWAVAHRSSSTAAEAEARRRLERWRTGSSPRWTLG